MPTNKGLAAVAAGGSRHKPFIGKDLGAPLFPRFFVALPRIPCYTVSMLTTTRYQKSIKPVPSDHVFMLKPGSNNKKLGFVVKKGKHKGKRIYSLTLPERETCPRSCHHWDDCYGNNMPFATRYSVSNWEAFIDRLEYEIATLLEKRTHKAGILIRLHVLGDFYSADYIRFWDGLLSFYGERLAVYGYTAHNPGSKLGLLIGRLNLTYPERCEVRYSHGANYNKTFDQRFAAEESFEGDAFDCPEQTGKVKDCASCALCWEATKTVRFLTH